MYHKIKTIKWVNFFLAVVWGLPVMTQNPTSVWKISIWFYSKKILGKNKHKGKVYESFNFQNSK